MDQAAEQFLGLAFIFANDYTTTPGFNPLPGTHTDARALRSALESLHFKCRVFTNLSASEFALELDRLTSSRAPDCCKYVVFAFCGHGNEQSLFAQDGKELPMGNLVDKFKADQMKNLASRIRLLFIDACRGVRRDEGVMVTVDSRGGKLLPYALLPLGSNMLVAFSTLIGYVSQEVKDGHVSKSMWMPILAEELAKTNDSIHTVLTTVNRKMIEYSTELKRTKPLIFPQSHFVGHTLFVPCNLYHDAQIFGQWMSASEYGTCVCTRGLIACVYISSVVMWSRIMC